MKGGPELILKSEGPCLDFDDLQPDSLKQVHGAKANEQLIFALGNENAGKFKHFDIINEYSDHHFMNGISKGLVSSHVRRGWLKKVQQEWSILKNDLPGITNDPSPQCKEPIITEQDEKQKLVPVPKFFMVKEFSDGKMVNDIEGGNSDFPMDLNQKEQLHDNVSLMQQQPQHFSMSRSSGFNLAGTYPSTRQQQQHATSAGSSGVSFAPRNNQDLIHIHSSDLFPSNHGAYHSQIQNSGPPSLGLRPMSTTYD